jgi:hypothetical protein
MSEISVNLATSKMRFFRERLSSQIFNVPATPLDLERFLKNKLEELRILKIVEEREVKGKRRD